MILREPSLKDLPEIEAIADKLDYPLIDRFDKAAVVTDKEGKIISFGVLRTDIEVVLYSGGRTDRETVASIKGLLHAAKEEAKKLGHSEIYAFVFDEGFAAALVRRYNFRRARGIPLILDLE